MRLRFKLHEQREDLRVSARSCVVCRLNVLRFDMKNG